MRAADHRRHIPVGVKLHACLLLLGFSEEEIAGGQIEWDHTPALALRSIDAETGEMTPHPNDPRYLEPRRKAEHAIKTRGRGATTAGSDVGAASKLKRIEKDPGGGEEFRRRLLAAKTGGKPPETKKRKHQWPSRPFNTRKKK